MSKPLDRQRRTSVGRWMLCFLIIIILAQAFYQDLNQCLLSSFTLKVKVGNCYHTFAVHARKTCDVSEFSLPFCTRETSLDVLTGQSSGKNSDGGREHNLRLKKSRTPLLRCISWTTKAMRSKNQLPYLGLCHQPDYFLKILTLLFHFALYFN